MNKSPRLKAGDPIPTFAPRRFRTRDGYVLLRWRIDVGTYVEALEHRIVAGVVCEAVHHKNGIKTDNRPENLEPLTRSAHMSLHVARKFDRVEAAELYRSGWSLPMIGRRFSVHPVTILRGLRQFGVRMRPLREAWAIRRVTHPPKVNRL